MKFSTIFSGLVAALAFTTALPIDITPESGLTTIDSISDNILETRALPEKLDEDKYQLKLKSLSNSYQDGKWYVFYDVTPRGQGDKMGDDAERIRDQLGYDHIKLVLGQYKETRKNTGPPKKPTGVTVSKKWQNINFYDLVVKDLKTQKTDQRINTWDPSRAGQLSFQGVANKGSASTATAAGKAFLTANPTWGKCESSHCGGYADAVHAAVK